MIPLKKLHQRTWLTVSEVAELLGIAERTVQEHCQAKLLPSRKFGREWKISVARIKNNDPETWAKMLEAHDCDDGLAADNAE